MIKTVKLRIDFKKPYEKPPKIKIIEPPKAQAKSIEGKGFDVLIPVNPHITTDIRVIFFANTDREEVGILTQFCPGCGELLGKWPVILVLVGPQNQVPISVCPLCGNLFMDRKCLHKTIAAMKGEKQIIIPGRG